MKIGDPSPPSASDRVRLAMGTLVTEIDIFCRWAATQSNRVGALGGGGTMRER